MCEIGAKVFSIERHLNLFKKAKSLLKKLNYYPKLKHGDGYVGIKEDSPYDKILVTCGATELPPELINQLKIGGFIVIPIGCDKQMMTVIVKHADGVLKKIEYENFKFVPFLRNKK